MPADHLQASLVNIRSLCMLLPVAVIGALMGLKLWAPLVVAAGLLAAGSVAMMLLPEMALRPLEDTVADAEESTAHRAASGLATGLKGLSASRMVLPQGCGTREKPLAGVVHNRWSHEPSMYMHDGSPGTGEGGAVAGLSVAGLAERQFHSAPGQAGDLHHSSRGSQQMHSNGSVSSDRRDDLL